MAEIAGLVLGGIPIAIWALEKYAEPLEAYHNYRTVIETLRTDLILQKRQLEITLSSVGLEKPSAAELQECFEAKYPTIHRELILIIKRMDNSTAQLLKDLNIDINGKPQWTNNLPDRTQWEWRRVKRCFSSKKRQGLIDDLRKWNEDLRNCLERTETAAEDDIREVQLLIKRFNQTHCSLIRSCLKSFHRALGSALNCNCLSSHQATIDLDWNLEPPSTSWVFTAGLSYQAPPGSPLSSHLWRKFQVTAERASIVDSQATMPFALKPTAGTPSPSRAERSPLSLFKHKFHRPDRAFPTTPIVVQTSAPPLPLAKSIADLCAEVRRQCASRSISGHLQDPDIDNDQHFSQFFLDKTLKELPSITGAISLKELLSRQKTHQCPTHLALSAKQRYGIAASVAWSVLHLSDSPWLQDGWDRSQIKVFVEETSEGQELISQHPCTSYAFHRSTTPNQSQSLATGNFDHLVPNKTTFTLGLILIELCLKKPFEQLQQSLGALTGGNTISATLLDEYNTAVKNLDDVYREAGDLYGNAAQRCVRCSFHGSDATKRFNIEQFRIQFYNTVVAPVLATYHMIPGSIK